MCPLCRTDHSKVLETRRHDDQVFRRRLCECGEKFITREYAKAGMQFPEEFREASLQRIREHKESKDKPRDRWGYR